MSADPAAPSRPDLIDRLRDLIAELFGRGGGGRSQPAPARARAAGPPFVGRPGDAAQLAEAPFRRSPAA